MSGTNDSATMAVTYGSNLGRVKWFNSKLGYGFITTKVNGEDVDIFAHQSNVKPNVSKYRTLREGEYVSLNVSTSGETQQAVDITGVHGGNLLCDLIRTTRMNSRDVEDTDGGGDIEITEVTSKRNRKRNN